jgi:hypothetical protein
LVRVVNRTGLLIITGGEFLFVRLKFLERSDKKFVSRTIPLKAEGIIPRCSAAEFGSRACPGVHTRDFHPHILLIIILLGGYRYVIAENMSIKCTYSYEMPGIGPNKKDGGIHEISLVLEFSRLHLFKSSQGSSYLSLSQKSIDNSQLAYNDF